MHFTSELLAIYLIQSKGKKIKGKRNQMQDMDLNDNKHLGEDYLIAQYIKLTKFKTKYYYGWST